MLMVKNLTLGMRNLVLGDSELSILGDSEDPVDSDSGTNLHLVIARSLILTDNTYRTLNTW